MAIRCYCSSMARDQQHSRLRCQDPCCQTLWFQRLHRTRFQTCHVNASYRPGSIFTLQICPPSTSHAGTCKNLFDQLDLPEVHFATSIRLSFERQVRSIIMLDFRYSLYLYQVHTIYFPAEICDSIPAEICCECATVLVNQGDSPWVTTLVCGSFNEQKAALLRSKL
jgi:hypothetical protein